MLSQVVNSPFIHKLNNLIRIFSASNFFTLSVISFLLTFFGDFKKFIGGLVPLRDSLFRMYLLSHTRVLLKWITKLIATGYVICTEVRTNEDMSSIIWDQNEQ